jgi:hypothetical protein
MVDPTSDLDEDVDESNAPACAVCDTKLVRDPNHRVVTWVVDNEIQVRHFCSDDCRGAWDDSERT